jgi:hypothetical protein
VQEDGRWVAHSADVYRAMVQAAYPAIKDAAPASRVLVGATSSFGSSRPGEAGVPPLAFLRRLACVDERLQPIETGGCAGYRPLPGDGWSHHPYSLRTTPDVRPRDPDNVPVASLDRLAFVLRALAQSGRIARADAGIYLTEYGYETNPPDPQARFGAADQAGLLAWGESLASAVPAVRSWPQFLLRDRPGDPAGPLMRPFGDWQSGLLYADGSPKPAYAEFRAPAAAECVATTGGLRTRIWARLRQPPAGVAGWVDIGTVRGWRSVAPRVARAAGAPDPGSLEAWLPGAPAAHLRLTWATSSGAVAVADLATRPCPRAAAARGHRSLRSRSPRNADGRHRRGRRRS